jgi:CheY-like chemotaxis protein
MVKEDALPEKEEREDIPQGTERIFFIDDEQLLAEMGKVMLERLGYQATVRRSSFEALETFQNTPNAFDLVITDQTMHVV